MNILTNEPSLVLKRSELKLRYYFKMKCYLLNPAYECVLNDTLHRLLAVGGTVASVFIVRVGEEIRRFNLPTKPVLPFKTMQIPIWGLELPMMDYNLTSMDKRNTPCSIVIGMYKETVTLKYRQHKKIFTDGSKHLPGVGAAAVVGDVVRRRSLPALRKKCGTY